MYRTYVLGLLYLSPNKNIWYSVYLYKLMRPISAYSGLGFRCHKQTSFKANNAIVLKAKTLLTKTNVSKVNKKKKSFKWHSLNCIVNVLC